MKVFFVFLLVFTSLNAQTNQYFQFATGIGTVLPEYTNATLTTIEPNKNFAGSWYRRTAGSKNDELLFNNPDLGVLFQFQTLGNKEVNGSEFSLLSFTRLHLLKERSWNLLWQIGIGLSGVTKKYDAIENPQNIAIGSHLNIHFNSQFLLSYTLKRLEFTTGLSFDHLSNGNLSEPNIGINSLYWNIGLAYRLNKEMADEKFENGIKEEKPLWSVIGAVGGKHTRALQDNFFFVSSLSADYTLISGKRFSTSVGPDVFYDSSIRKENPSFKNNITTDLSTGLHITEQVHYKSWSFALQLGAYLGLKEQSKNKAIYSRGFIQYNFKKGIYTRLSMKSHLHILEFPELGVGFRWGRK